MKRPVAAVVFMLLFAAALDAAETRRYVVVTKQPFREGRLIAALQDSGVDFTPRAVLGFKIIDGFAADLTDDEVASLRKSRQVSYVEEVVVYKAMAVQATQAAQVVPYGIDLVHARDAWPAGRGGEVNVVVIDTGIDYTHPELKGIFAGGRDFQNGDDDPLDDNGHGTHVSGTIAAADNDFGVVGVAPQVKLWGLKVLNASGSGTSDKTIAAMDWVVAKKQELGGRWVVNLSLGGAQKTIASEQAFGRAVDSGVMVVAASGNESEVLAPAPVGYPAAFRGVLAIGAVDQQKALAFFSNQGPELSFVAPGVQVLSTQRVGTPGDARVTSPAATYIAATVGGTRAGSVTGTFVDCGVGRPEDFTSAVNGKIALIERGSGTGVVSITFADKTKRALAAGATAVAIYNNADAETDHTTWSLSLGDPTFTNWPVTVGLSRADGLAIRAQAGSTITVTIDSVDYGTASGTSMATPHAAGVVALVWSIAPNATAAELRTALEQTASDLGASGRDSVFGFGLVDALAAAKQLNPAAFGTGGTPQPGKVTTGRRILKRGR